MLKILQYIFGVIAIISLILFNATQNVILDHFSTLFLGATIVAIGIMELKKIKRVFQATFVSIQELF